VSRTVRLWICMGARGRRWERKEPRPQGSGGVQFTRKAPLPRGRGSVTFAAH
jgi:hypothetical protein